MMGEADMDMDVDDNDNDNDAREENLEANQQDNNNTDDDEDEDDEEDDEEDTASEDTQMPPPLPAASLQPGNAAAAIATDSLAAPTLPTSAQRMLGPGERCGHCKTCLKPALKKACITRKKQEKALKASGKAPPGIAPPPLPRPPPPPPPPGGAPPEGTSTGIKNSAMRVLSPNFKVRKWRKVWVPQQTAMGDGSLKVFRWVTDQPKKPGDPHVHPEAAAAAVLKQVKTPLAKSEPVPRRRYFRLARWAIPSAYLVACRRCASDDRRIRWAAYFSTLAHSQAVARHSVTKTACVSTFSRTVRSSMSATIPDVARHSSRRRNCADTISHTLVSAISCVPIHSVGSDLASTST